MMQAIAAGEAGSITQARDVVRQSFAVETYEPRHADRWEPAYQQFAQRHGF
jgi:rhamnulokinase